MNIPKQLKEFKFIKIKEKAKTPLEFWQKKDNQYSYDSIELNKYIEKANYGILTGNNLIVVDIDKLEILNELELPETFRVKTSKGYHYYYYSDLSSKIILQNKLGEHFGEIQSEGQYVVAPNSTHQTGIKYEVDKDIGLSYISKEEIYNIFNNYITTIKTTTSTNTIIHLEDNSEESINIFEDDRFKDNNYSIKEGISFIKIYDLKDFKESKYKFLNKERSSYKTKGDVNRSPLQFIENNIDILFVKTGIKVLRKKKVINFKDVYLIVYRASERLFEIEIVTSENYNNLILKTDEEIINFFPNFIKLSQSKLNNLKKHKNLGKIVSNLLKGIKDYTLTDNLMGEVMKEAIKQKLSNEKLHIIYKTHFEERYSEEETKAQIRYTKRLLEA